MTAPTIQERFEQFHDANPWVADELERLAAEAIRNGASKVGIRMLYEVMRWNHLRRTKDKHSDFKLNDHYHSRYVRLLLDRHPEWDGHFETRRLQAA